MAATSLCVPNGVVPVLRNTVDIRPFTKLCVCVKPKATPAPLQNALQDDDSDHDDDAADDDDAPMLRLRLRPKQRQRQKQVHQLVQQKELRRHRQCRNMLERGSSAYVLKLSAIPRCQQCCLISDDAYDSPCRRSV